MSAMLYTQTAEPLKMLLKGRERESDSESAAKKKDNKQNTGRACCAQVLQGTLNYLEVVNTA